MDLKEDAQVAEKEPFGFQRSGFFGTHGGAQPCGCSEVLS